MRSHKQIWTECHLIWFYSVYDHSISLQDICMCMKIIQRQIWLPYLSTEMPDKWKLRIKGKSSSYKQN